MLHTKAVKAYIGLGSNLGDSKTLLQEAWQALGNVDGIVLDGLSSPYMTAPVDMTSQHWFTNAVGRLQVTLSPLELLHVLLAVEASFGRKRSEKKFGYQDRSLDLDLLYYGDIVMDSPELTLPHPRIGDRLFVLVPLAELEPDFRDTLSKKTVNEMEARLRERIDSTTNKKQEIIHGQWNE
ncbi:2-amino-4-hydroxy-6-hydroxymethyldihydropteridine diphosphokinase [Desulfopila sp. IMCC35006]|uniref:2-amino-4-hydroxy-6- hydroxymethyldihydropteridine diphosphokinase n=1 Tax=Desulfopila sp. IMCC35006 TaxID=2569542 RepID=UPI00142F0CE7|nr:2-amino-4-hydroxy-6-hydroxymethyldihydropteridine diphosphokinase [Desulfopila sp. IMCC35006]